MRKVKKLRIFSVANETEILSFVVDKEESSVSISDNTKGKMSIDVKTAKFLANQLLKAVKYLEQK